MDGPILVESPNIAGGDWNTVAEIVRKYTQKAVIEAKPTDEGGQVATRLAEADMDVFGLNPLDDSLNLVTCPNCSKPIKNSRFAAHWDHCAKEGPRRAIEEEEVLEEGTSVGQSNDPLKLKIKKPPRGLKRKDGEGFDGEGASDDGGDDVSPSGNSSSPSSSYQVWLDIAVKNVPLPLATKDYTRRNPLREAIIANAAPPPASSSYLQQVPGVPGMMMGPGVTNFLASPTGTGALTAAHLTPSAKNAALHAAANINRKMGASPHPKPPGMPGGVAAAPGIDAASVNRKMGTAPGYGQLPTGSYPPAQYPMGSSAVYIAGTSGNPPYGTPSAYPTAPPTTPYGAAAQAGFPQANAAYNSQAAFAQAAGAANAQVAGAYQAGRYPYVGTQPAKPPTTQYARTASGVTTVPVIGQGVTQPGTAGRVYYAQ